jgi:hypothetical protein
MLHKRSRGDGGCVAKKPSIYNGLRMSKNAHPEAILAFRGAILAKKE